MPQSIIDPHTDENIKNFLSEESGSEKIGGMEPPNKRNPNSKGGKGIFRSKKLAFGGLFLVLAVIIAAAYFMYIRGQRSFDNKKVKVEIETSREIASGEEVVFSIKYKNGTNVELKNPRISFFVPKEFVFVSSDKEAQKEPAVISWSLNNLSVGESGAIKLFGRIIGKKDSKYEFNSRISYTPDNFNYEFESADSSSKAELKIISSPFELSVKASESVVSGDEVEYLIGYKNISGRSFEKVKIKVQFSDGFLYTFSQPEAGEKREKYLSWDVENLDLNAEGKLIARGSLSGEKSSKEQAKIILEASENGKDLIEYVSEEVSTEIQEAPVAFSQTVNGLDNYFASKGEELEYKIRFKNTSEKEIRGLVVNSQLDGNVDFNSLEIANGSHDDKYKITWSAFNVPKLAVLAPQEEDEVSFKVRVENYIDVKSPNDKNFVIKNKAAISIFNFSSDSLKIERAIASSESTVKINGSLFINAKGYFNDDGRILNSGFIPPEVGKKTTYTIHWNLSSLLNDLRNIRIVSVLPEHVKWAGNYIKPNGEISLGDENNGTFTPVEDEGVENKVEIIGDLNSESNEIRGSLKGNNQFEEKQIEEEKFYYNIKTREIVWEIPRLDANTGAASPAKEVVFQISVIPKDIDAGDVMKIMGKIEAVGYDEFTNKKIITSENELTTELPDDDSIGVEEGIVIKSSGEEN